MSAKPTKLCPKCGQAKDINGYQPSKWELRSGQCRACSTKGGKGGGTPAQRRMWVRGVGLERTELQG